MAGMRLSDLLSPSLVKLDLVSKAKEELFDEMVEIFVDAGLVNDRDLALQVLFEREAEMSTGISKGFGLPHGELPGIEEPCMVLGISHKGIAYDALDEEPVHVVLMVLFKVHDPESHISILTEVSRLFSVPGFVERLASAETAEQALDTIRNENGCPVFSG